jgi:Fusaric acid resistance protein-like
MTVGLGMATGITRWLDRIDPGAHRRIKGLRLVTAYGIAAMLGALHDVAQGLPDAASLSALAGGFALWASVSEGQTTRRKSARDLALLSAGAALGATSFIGLAPLLASLGHAGPELTLATGAFLVGYLRRFGILGTGLGSQVYIGQLYAFGTGLTDRDLKTVVMAGAIAAVAAIVPRMLSGPAERPPPFTDVQSHSIALSMGLQAAVAAMIIVLLDRLIGLTESAWAITACVYVIANSPAGTIERVRRRIIGTVIGVPLGLAFLPVAGHAPVVIWVAAALAMIVYAMALPERYDIACGAFAFTLIATLAATGEHSIPLLAARAWETLIGGMLGLVAALLLFPIHAPQAEAQ